MSPGSNPYVRFELGARSRHLESLDGKALLVHIVVNVEHWPFDQPMPRAILPAPHGAESVPDVPNFSWVEYGMRWGLPRIIEVIAGRQLPASLAINSSVIDIYPEAAKNLLATSWEFIGHGVYQRSLQAERDERAIVRESLLRIERFTGSRPRGWLGPGLKESELTLGILKSEGIEYVCDWALDDLPFWIDTAAGQMVGVPYTLELNDSVIYAVEHHSSAEFYLRFQNTLRVLARELHQGARVLTLALHPHLIGVPHRITYLEQTLDDLQAREDVVFVTGGRIAQWFIEEMTNC